MTVKPISGSIVIFLPNSFIRILQASRLRPLMRIASDPHTPCAHERRYVRVPSWLPLDLVERVEHAVVRLQTRRRTP